MQEIKSENTEIKADSQESLCSMRAKNEQELVPCASPEPNIDLGQAQISKTDCLTFMQELFDKIKAFKTCSVFTDSYVSFSLINTEIEKAAQALNQNVQMLENFVLPTNITDEFTTMERAIYEKYLDHVYMGTKKAVSALKDKFSANGLLRDGNDILNLFELKMEQFREFVSVNQTSVTCLLSKTRYSEVFDKIDEQRELFDGGPYETLINRYGNILYNCILEYSQSLVQVFATHFTQLPASAVRQSAMIKQMDRKFKERLEDLNTNLKNLLNSAPDQNVLSTLNTWHELVKNYAENLSAEFSALATKIRRLKINQISE